MDDDDELVWPHAHAHSTTLFVANLPYDATSTDLQTAFSDLAPVRSAFVVLAHGTRVSKGVGYVAFSAREDAQSALDAITADGMAIHGRPVRVAWADTKRRPVLAQPTPRANDPLAIRTVVVSGLPASLDRKTLWKKLRKFGAEDVTWPAGDEPSTAHALFSSSSLAQDAVHKLHAHVFKGTLLSATLKKRLDSLSKPTQKTSRASRLIVRNLPFDVTEQDLRAIFLPYGPIHSIHVPSDDPHARSKGFAFVWMLSRKDAQVALEKCNGIKVTAGMASDIVSDKQKRKKQRREEKKRHADSEEEETVVEPEQTGKGGKERVIAVDWALSKERWAKENEKLEEEEADDDVEMADADSDAATSEDSDAESEHEPLGIHEEEEDGEEEDEDEIDPDRDSDDESPQKPQLPHTDTGSTVFVRNVPFNATEDEVRMLFRAFGPLRYVRLTVDPDTGRPRGTGFACFWNKEDADKAIQQSDILRTETTGSTPHQPPKNPFSLPSLLTPDPSAGLAKNLVLHGRTLDVVRAVTREQAAKLQEDGEKSREKADKRHLYLLREGVILPNSPAAQTIPQIELEKRTNAFNARRTMLRTNPSLYISLTRLSVRQIPLFVTERGLKRLAMHAVRAFDADVVEGVREGLTPDELVEPAAALEMDDAVGSKKRKQHGGRHTRVKQAKIVRQADRVDPITGKGRSRGYGFVEMHTHADALRVLRWANNNPDLGALFDAWWKEELADLLTLEKTKAEGGDEARVARMKGEMETAARSVKGTLIVEFSIENVQVVRRRAALKEKLSKVQNARKPGASRTEEPPTKKRRISSEQSQPKTVRIKEETPKPGKVIGSVIGRKRRARKAGKSAR